MADEHAPGAGVPAPAGPTYIAAVGTIRRDCDGLLSTRWGLLDADTREPVTTGEPGPWTWTDASGNTWRHVGRGSDRARVRLFEFLSQAELWAQANGAAAFIAGRQRYVFRRPEVSRG